MIDISPMVLALVPIVIGLVQIGKMYVAERYAPLMALLLGIAGSLLLHTSSFSIDFLGGLIVGLMACGLYSGTKTTMQP